jgi:hypothetical protein
VLRPSTKGSTAIATMPPPVVPATAARKVPSPTKASEVEVARGGDMGGTGEASQELFVDDYLIEGVSMIDAHTGLAAGDECIYYCVCFTFVMVCGLLY